MLFGNRQVTYSPADRSGAPPAMADLGFGPFRFGLSLWREIERSRSLTGIRRKTSRSRRQRREQPCGGGVVAGLWLQTWLERGIAMPIAGLCAP